MCYLVEATRLSNRAAWNEIEASSPRNAKVHSVPGPTNQDKAHLNSVWPATIAANSSSLRSSAATVGRNVASSVVAASFGA